MRLLGWLSLALLSSCAPKAAQAPARVVGCRAPDRPIGAVLTATYGQELAGFRTRAVMVRDLERRLDDGTKHIGDWVAFDTSYAVVGVRGRTAGDFVVLGERDDGGLTLERWILSRREGAWSIDRPAQPAPIGTPVPAMVPPELVIEGGRWISPEQRSGRVRARRTTITEEVDGAPVAALEVDPDGRYVVYAGKGVPGIYRALIGAPTDQAEELLFDATELPNPDRIRGLYFVQHAALGRLLVGTYGAFDFDHVAVMADADNDGIFESAELRTRAEWEAWHTGGLILDDFATYDI